MGIFDRKREMESAQKAHPDQYESIDGYEIPKAVLSSWMNRSKELTERGADLAENGDVRAALELQLEAVARMRVVVGLTPTVKVGTGILGRQIAKLGGYYGKLGEKDAAIAYRREAARLQSTIAEVDDNAATMLTVNLVELAALLDTSGTREEMVQVCAEAVRWLREPGPASLKGSGRIRARALNRLANGQNDLGRKDEALLTRLEHIEVLEELESKAPATQTARLLTGLSSLAVLQLQAGKHEDGVAAGERCRALLATPDFAPSAADRAVVARNFDAVARNLRRLGRPEESEAWFAASAELLRAVGIEKPGSFRRDLVRVLNNHAYNLGRLGRFDEGLAIADEALALCETQDTEVSGGLARIHMAMLDTAAELRFLAGDYAGALPLSRKSIALGQDLSAQDPLNPGIPGALEHCKRLLARIEDRLPENSTKS